MGIMFVGLVGPIWRVHPREGRAGVRRRRAIAPAAAAFVLATAAVFAGSFEAANASSSRARSSRAVTLSESGRLHLTSKQSFTLNEQGSASGTITGTIYIHLHLTSSTRVTAEVGIYPSGGSLSGNGSAAYRVEGAVAAFTGTLAITRGTGKYAHARASGLRFTGTIQRRGDAVSVHLSGPLSY
jgi:hypothetical protein